MQDLYVLAGSALVIAFMLGVAALLGFRERVRLTEADMRARLAEAEPNARLTGLALSADADAALAYFEDGRFAALRAMGDRLAYRSFASSAARFSRRGAFVIIRFGDLGFPALHLKLDSVPDWLAARLDQKQDAGAHA